MPAAKLGTSTPRYTKSGSKRFFLPRSQASAEHPELLIVDGYKIHISYRVAKTAIDNQMPASWLYASSKTGYIDKIAIDNHVTIRLRKRNTVQKLLKKCLGYCKSLVFSVPKI